MLEDLHHRKHSYLRISLTDNCNFRCSYCMPNEDYEFLRPHRLMSAKEIVSIAAIFTELGVTKIRLTGGEPLIRKDLPEIIAGLSKLPIQLTLTTNGLLLDRYIDLLKEYNIRSVNISLDTLQAEKFKQITRRDEFNRVWDNIQLLVAQEFEVKLNVVAVKNQVEDEIIDFALLTRRLPLEIRFIEFMPFDGNFWDPQKVLTAGEIQTMIETQFPLEKMNDSPNDTAKHYKIPGALGKIAFITTMSDHFCATCNRLRLTADGKIKNCLFDKHELDLLTSYRTGEDIKSLILQSVKQKNAALGGQFTPKFTETKPEQIINRSMIKIGG
jgi:molybdenum cofactor biosynthesis protein A